MSNVGTSMVEIIARAVEKSPLSPDIESFINSFELTADEKTEVVTTLNDMKFKGDELSALPNTPTDRQWRLELLPQSSMPSIPGISISRRASSGR
jgi:hypothetical protein